MCLNAPIDQLGIRCEGVQATHLLAALAGDAAKDRHLPQDCISKSWRSFGEVCIMCARWPITQWVTHHSHEQTYDATQIRRTRVAMVKMTKVATIALGATAVCSKMVLPVASSALTAATKPSIASLLSQLGHWLIAIRGQCRD